jgi:predicted metal-binding protein
MHSEREGERGRERREGGGERENERELVDAALACACARESVPDRCSLCNRCRIHTWLSGVYVVAVLSSSCLDISSILIQDTCMLRITILKKHVCIWSIS